MKITTKDKSLDILSSIGIVGSTRNQLSEIMIKFATCHVQAALKEALDNVPYGSSTDTVSYEDVEHILTCYNLDNIK